MIIVQGNRCMYKKNDLKGRLEEVFYDLLPCF